MASVVIGDHLAAKLPDADVDVRRMFREPADIVLDFRDARGPEQIWRGLLGNGYASPGSLRATPLVARLRHVVAELATSDGGFERKLRYLI